ncbi:MAG: hypothetical protein FJZ11_04030 [Candidatus Omnitrophica bacterium]|nr:hypothetical protein [Candidatus Omnitrophota bacterium]
MKINFRNLKITKTQTEQGIISHLLNSPLEINRIIINEYYFDHETFRALYKAIKKMVQEKGKTEIDIDAEAKEFEPIAPSVIYFIKNNKKLLLLPLNYYVTQLQKLEAFFNIKIIGDAQLELTKELIAGYWNFRFIKNSQLAKSKYKLYILDTLKEGFNTIKQHEYYPYVLITDACGENDVVNLISANRLLIKNGYTVFEDYIDENKIGEILFWLKIEMSKAIDTIIIMPRGKINRYYLAYIKSKYEVNMIYINLGSFYEQ